VGFTEPAAGRIRDATPHYLEAVVRQEWPVQQHGVVTPIIQLDHPFRGEISVSENAFEAVLKTNITH
jgi:hypothetical protein